MQNVQTLSRPAKDLTGERFGRWLVLRRSQRKKSWFCRCECGTERDVWTVCLRTGSSKSCGCLPHGNLRHGHTLNGSTSPEYRAWCQIKRRCEDQRAAYYKDYGGRGITVCERWRNDFAAFFADVGSRPSSQHTIDRYPNNDGNYEPGNVRWATRKEQARNRRSSRVVSIEKKRMTVAELAEVSGLAYSSISGRVLKGFGIDKVLFKGNLKIRDLTGLRFDRWTVIQRSGPRKWRCVCECGREKDVYGTNLTTGKSKSCGRASCTADGKWHGD